MLKKLTLALTARRLLSALTTAEETKQPPTAPPLDAFPRLFGRIVSWVAPFGGATLARGI